MIIFRIILKIKLFGLLVSHNILISYLFQLKKIFLILISYIGASSGIGRELVKELHRISPTTRLVISARRENELKSLADELNLDSDRCLILPLDLEIHDYGFQSKLHLVLNQFGCIDVLINNAGISQRSLITDTIYTVDSRLMNINFLGTITLSKTVLSVNRKRNFLLIIFILKTILAIYSSAKRTFCCCYISNWLYWYSITFDLCCFKTCFTWIF